MARAVDHEGVQGKLRAHAVDLDRRVAVHDAAQRLQAALEKKMLRMLHPDAVYSDGRQ